jgi:hypothetical protein
MIIIHLYKRFEGLKVWYESGKFYRLRNLPQSGIFLKGFLMSFRKNGLKVWQMVPEAAPRSESLTFHQDFPTAYPQQ